MTGKAIDIAGQRFGRLEALEPVPRVYGEHGSTHWLCRCDCGAYVTLSGSKLRSGNTQSCGCLRRDVTTTRNTMHGLSNTPTYGSWKSMIHRATNPSNSHYPNWGGRGITVDPRWLSYENFLADMGERPPGRTLERVDNNGPYAKWNCTWATPKEQMMNTRSFKLVPDVVAEIIRLRKDGLTVRLIAGRTHLSTATVSKALRDHGVTRGATDAI